MLVFYICFIYVVHMSDGFETSFQSSSNVCYFVVILWLDWRTPKWQSRAEVVVYGKHGNGLGDSVLKRSDICRLLTRLFHSFSLCRMTMNHTPKFYKYCMLSYCNLVTRLTKLQKRQSRAEMMVRSKHENELGSSTQKWFGIGGLLTLFFIFVYVEWL